MKVLVLGYSSLARRRILPALASLSVNADLASVTREPAWPQAINGRSFRDYREALAGSDAELVYVSTRNHEHVEWVHRALDAGRHVIVDKPAALSLADVEAMASHASRSGRLLAEATTWPWHPQVDHLKRKLADVGPVTRLTAIFSFPQLPDSDVRYRPEWGGGALWDLGPYAVSSARLIFGHLPQSISVQVATQDGKDVETAFSVLARYPDDRLLAGHFGFMTAYVNRLDAFGPRCALSLERAFTTTPDQSCRISGQTNGIVCSDEIPACDAFARFLADALQAVPLRNFDHYLHAMLHDAEALAQLRTAALG